MLPSDFAADVWWISYNHDGNCGASAVWSGFDLDVWLMTLSLDYLGLKLTGRPVLKSLDHLIAIFAVF